MRKRSWRWGALLITAVLLLTVIIWKLEREKNVCMGVDILSDTDYAHYTEYVYNDLSCLISQDDKAAAIDIATSTIYISQDITSDTILSELVGVLTIEGGYRFGFAPDPAFDDLFHAVAEGHRFKLLASADQMTYMQYDVIFTTLPVLKLDGSVSGVNEDYREVFSGDLCLWTPKDPDAGKYTVKTSELQWHIRGGASVTLDKKSWKLSLKTQTGKNQGLSLVGLGADDDWILNAMAFDDLKIREKFAIHLWESIQSNSADKVSMSDGEYIEVVINGTYQGLYLLQRRVDGKFLSLSDRDVLMKGQPTYTPANIYEAYEVVYSALGDAAAYNTAQHYYSTFAPESINLDNWINVELLLQIGYMVDNCGNKNMYYLHRQQAELTQISLIPWDTDMSFGIIWDQQIRYDPTVMDTAGELFRHEYSALKIQYPDLDERIAVQWQYMRETWLSADFLQQIAVEYRQHLAATGAVERDESRWGNLNKGQDTIENFLQFIEKRISWLDDYYSKYLPN